MGVLGGCALQDRPPSARRVRVRSSLAFPSGSHQRCAAEAAMQQTSTNRARPFGGAAAPHSRACNRRPFEAVRPSSVRNQRPVRAGAAPPGNNDSGNKQAGLTAGGGSGGAGRLSRLLSWRSSAQPAVAAEAKTTTSTPTSDAAAAEEWQMKQQVAAAALRLQQQQQLEQQPGPGEEQPPPQQQPLAAGTAARSGAFSLYSWLTWGSGAAPASPAGGSVDADSGTALAATAAAELADGMAAAEPASLPAAGSSGSGSASSAFASSYWRRSWYASLSRASQSSSGSFDEAEAAAAAGAAMGGSTQQARQPRQQRWQQRVPLGHPALQLMRQRALSGSRPGQRRDPFKLGLVVEGGGMRGCVSGGALQALTDLGLRDVFDAVYGSSAGAINSTFFLSGQREGVDIYHDHISCDDFISLKRLWKSRGAGYGSSSGFSSGSGSGSGSMDEEPTPVLNLSFLIDHVMHSVQPLDWDAVLASPVPLKVVASSLDTLNSVLLHSFTDRADLAECLKASATVPEIAGGPRLHRGQRLVDAAVFEPVPFRSAIADGCTHLLVLCTRPLLLTRRSRVNAALADAMEVAIKRAVMSPDYMVPAWKAEVDYLAKDGISQDDMLLKAATEEEAHTLPWFAGAHVLPLYPGTAANFSPLCTDVPTLQAGIEEGRRNVLAVCRALLGDSWDFSGFPELESSNIVPTRSPTSSAQLWRRYLADDANHHA